MNNTEQFFPQNLQIQGILDKYLSSRTSAENLQDLQELHLDEDSLAAFVEGSLTLRESKNAVNHLVKCSFCRHITAELIKLDTAFSEREENYSMVAKDSKHDASVSSISEVLNGLLSRLFGTSEGAVFAHQEKDDAEEAEKSEDK